MAQEEVMREGEPLLSRPLLAFGEAEPVPAPRKAGSRGGLVVALVAAVALAGAVALSSTSGFSSSDSASLSTANDGVSGAAHAMQMTFDDPIRAPGTLQGVKSSLTDVQITYTSYYESKLNITIGDNLYDNLYVESNQVTTFLVTNNRGSASLTIVQEGESKSTGVALSDSSTWSHTFDVPTAYTMYYLDDDSRFSFTVYCRTVRRELRDLTDSDRTKYFDTLKVLYSTSEEAGREIYGTNFHSAAWLIRMHLEGAADKDCDHWHDDAGFLNHHIGITMQFERSMQAVDKTVAAHYWDYTIDSAKFGTSGWRASPIFDDDWFGVSVPQSKTHAIDVGRWAYTKVMSNAQVFSAIHNPYGLLRSPWNTNAVPYVMRHSYVIGYHDGGWTMSTCKDFQDTLNHSTSTGQTPWMGYLQYQLNGMLHGPVHIMLGGHWRMEPIENLTADFSEVDKMTSGWSNWLLVSKELWREGFLRCPETCSSDTPQRDCMCTCPSEARDGASAEEIMLKLSGVNNIAPDIAIYWHEKFQLSWDVIFDNLCSVGHPGEMFSSAAPQDPIFWPLHGQSERYVQMVRLAARHGFIDIDEQWGYQHIKRSVNSDTRLVCDWSNVTEGSYERPDCSTGTCPGHKASDLLPFDNLFGDHGTYSNAEFYNMTAPDSTYMSYVYDKLISWDGCPGGKFTIPRDTL